MNKKENVNVINIDNNIVRSLNPLSKLLLERIHWPSNATCATQEKDGEILYWSCDIKYVEKCKQESEGSSMIEIMGLAYQVDSWYLDDNLVASDQLSTVVKPNDLIVSYLDLLQKNKVPFNKGLILLEKLIQRLGNKVDMVKSKNELVLFINDFQPYSGVD